MALATRASDYIHSLCMSQQLQYNGQQSRAAQIFKRYPSVAKLFKHCEQECNKDDVIIIKL